MATAKTTLYVIYRHGRQAANQSMTQFMPIGAYYGTGGTALARREDAKAKAADEHTIYENQYLTAVPAMSVSDDVCQEARDNQDAEIERWEVFALMMTGPVEPRIWTCGLCRTEFEAVVFPTTGRLVMCPDCTERVHPPPCGLSNFRKRLGLSQFQLAELLGVSQGTVENWEASGDGSRKPPAYLSRALRDLEREWSEFTTAE